MNGNSLKDWRVVFPAALFLGAGGGVGGVTTFASNDKPSRTEVKEMIEDHPVIVVLKEDVKHLTNDVADNQEENREQFKQVLEAIRENGR